MIFEACKIMKMPYKLFDDIRGESETMAGLVLELAGEIPLVGKEFYAKDFTFTIMETGQNRILKVKVSILPQIF
jgi:CBS domain containing-hemolysin-like protein